MGLFMVVVTLSILTLLILAIAVSRRAAFEQEQNLWITGGLKIGLGVQVLFLAIYATGMLPRIGSAPGILLWLGSGMGGMLLGFFSMPFRGKTSNLAISALALGVVIMGLGVYTMIMLVS